MAGKVIFDLDAREAALVKKLESAEKKADRLQRALYKAGKSGAGSFDSAGASIKNVALGMIGAGGITSAVQKVVSVVRSAYDEMLQSHRNFLANIQERSSARIKYLAFAKDTTDAEADAQAANVSKKAGIAENRAFDILRVAASAGADKKFREDTAITAGTFEKYGVADGETLVGPMIDIAKRAGKEDPRAALAQLFEIVYASRAETIEDAVKVVKTITAGMLAGDTVEGSAEYSTAITQILADADNSVSQTAGANFIGALRLKPIMPVERMDPKTGKKKVEFEKIRGGETTEERLDILRKAYSAASPEMKEIMLDKFLEKVGGRAVAKGAMEQIFMDTPLWQKELGTSQTKISSFGSQEAMDNLQRLERYSQTGDSAAAVVVANARAAETNLKTKGRGDVAASVEAYDLAIKTMKQEGVKGQITSYLTVGANIVNEIAKMGENIPWWKWNPGTLAGKGIRKAGMGAYFGGDEKTDIATTMMHMVGPGENANPAVAASFQDSAESVATLVSTSKVLFESARKFENAVDRLNNQTVERMDEAARKMGEQKNEEMPPTQEF